VKAITGFPMSMEGKTAACDLWSDESAKFLPSEYGP
jgi:hypothetical protein